ncbi:hypothetical protein [Streptomyces sp. NRRL S-475]|uniref:hypothetical protein n=1 Tax=Streptomyces sp. NRRL S-475 TaxID=1463910 RepID=UPI0004CBBDC2|nr:hypothetical protein [Streptomyces sp. NRRL S-475]
MNGDWLLRGRDGRLTVYLPSGDAVLCRAERGPAGSWEDTPRTVGGSQKLHPGAAVGQGADGYAHLAAWRPTVPGESGLVHSTHFRPGLAALDWVPIGHPDQKGDRTGPPAVAVDGAGRGYVFVRNKAGGVSLRNQKVKGGWGGWLDLGGQEVEGELAAVTGESGFVELYASVPGGILRWRQEGDGKKPVPAEGVDAPVRPGTLRALATSAEHTTLFFTDRSGDLCAWRPGEKPVTLLASAGPGPVSAVRCVIEGHDCTVLAQRSASGRVAFAAYPTEQESAGAWWTESGPPLPADAMVSVALDEHDEVVAASLSPSAGTVLLTRRKGEPGLALEAWREI